MFSNRNCWRSMFEPSRIPFCRVVYVFELNSDCKLLSDPISLNFDLSNIVMFRGVWQDIVLFFVKREVFFARSHGYTGFPTLSGLFKLCLKMITIWFFSGLFLVQFCMCLVGLCSLLHDDTLGNWTVIAESCLTFFPSGIPRIKGLIFGGLWHYVPFFFWIWVFNVKFLVRSHAWSWSLHCVS